MTELNEFVSMYDLHEDGTITNKKGIEMKYGNKDGFCTVTLNKEGKRKSFLVHRLIATKYVPNPENYKYVIFKDKNKRNCAASNLLWSDRKTEGINPTIQVRKIRTYTKYIARWNDGKSYSKWFNSEIEAKMYLDEKEKEIKNRNELLD